MFDETEIYSFSDGFRTRRVDPMVILRKINQTPDLHLDTDLKLIQSGQAPDCWDALERVVKAARAAFGLPEYEEETGDGVSETKALKILAEFMEYTVKKNKSTDKPPTSAKRFQGRKSPSETTKPTSASGSTGTGR